MPTDAIMIYRDFQIINDYVQIPPNNETDKNRVDVDTAVILMSQTTMGDPALFGIQALHGEIQLSLGSGPCTGSKHGAQRTFRLPPVIVGQKYTTDPVTILNS